MKAFQASPAQWPCTKAAGSCVTKVVQWFSCPVAAQDMIENVRREKRERDAMRVEEHCRFLVFDMSQNLLYDQDKYTDMTDPVVTQEQRMQQQASQQGMSHVSQQKRVRQSE